MSHNILFCGDTHGRLQHVVDAALRLGPMAVVLLGDIEAPRPLHLELAPIRERVWWIRGNHDTDTSQNWAHLADSELGERCIDGRVVTLPDGTRLAGLGGIFREAIWRPPAEPHYPFYDNWLTRTITQQRPGPAKLTGQRLKHRSSIFPFSYHRLANERADILVTHEAGASHPYGFDAIDELASAMGVQVTFHGHQHDCLDYRAQWERLGFRAFGVGLRGILDWDGNVIVPGEKDAERAHRGAR